MPGEFQFGWLQELAFLEAAPLPLQPFFRLFQLGAILLPRGLPFHFEVPVTRVPAIMREAEEIKRLRPLPTTPRALFGESSELQQSRLGWFLLQMKLRQPGRQFLVE